MFRAAHSRMAIGFIGGLLLLLMLPNVLWLWSAHGISVWVDALVFPLVLLAVWFALLGDWPWLACLLLAPFAALAPLEAFYIAQYHHPTSPEVIATLVATNPRETREYLGTLLIPLLLCMAAGLALALAAAWSSRHGRWPWKSRARAWIVTIAVATPLAAAIVAASSARGGAAVRGHAGITTLDSLAAVVTQGYPFGVISRVHEYRAEWLQMRAEAAKLDAFRFHASRIDALHQRQVYVLVIGESSRRDRWQLFGYDRPTNPELSRVRNLVRIPRMLTSWPESITAIPLILTRKPITSTSPEWHEASVLRAMQEAGFETYWISNQLAIGKFDSPVSTYAYEAEHVEWLNHASWTAPGSYDEDLVQPLRDALKDSNKDLFIVLHMMGSHLSYDYRYPASFKRFVPTYSDRASNVPQGERMYNSYDNTILYTDHVLAQIIGVLRDSKAVTAMWFLSDHGETLPTPTCDRAGHGIGSRYDFQVPAFFWYSNAYARDFPQRVATLRANADKRTLSADTFESLIDMTGVAFPGHDETWSLFSPQWRYRPRIVNPIWQTDYDKSQFGKGCEIVLPPNARSHPN
ncbi:MAG TPA: phosphoethanolamine transferase [Rhodanobacteraceae bacterium]|nr:phosphoethanolamine transferase [Rhodanobacteraceae bacterium]